MDRQSSRSAFFGAEGSRGRVNSSDGEGYQRPQANAANGGSGLSRGHMHMNLSGAFTNGTSSSSSQSHPFGTSVRSPLASPASSSFFSTTLQQAPPTPTHTTHPRSNTLSNFASSSSLARDYHSTAQQPQSDFPGATRSNSSGRTNPVSSFPPELLSSEPFPQSPSVAAPLHSPFDAPEGFGPPRRSATAGASLWGSSAIGPSSPGQLAPRTRDIWKQQSKETSSFFGDLSTPSRQNSGNSESSLWLNDASDRLSTSSLKQMTANQARGPPVRAATLATAQDAGFYGLGGGRLVSEPDAVLPDDVQAAMTAALDLDEDEGLRSASPSALEGDRTGVAFSGLAPSPEKKPLGSKRAMLLQGIRAPQRAATLDPSNHLPRPQIDSTSSQQPRGALSPVQDSSETSATSRSSSLNAFAGGLQEPDAEQLRQQQAVNTYSQMRPYEQNGRHGSPWGTAGNVSAHHEDQSGRAANAGAYQGSYGGAHRGFTEQDQHAQVISSLRQPYNAYTSVVSPLPPATRAASRVHASEHSHSNAAGIPNHVYGKTHNGPMGAYPRETVRPGMPQNGSHWRTEQQQLGPHFAQQRQPDYAEQQLYHALGSMNLGPEAYAGSAAAGTGQQRQQGFQQGGTLGAPLNAYSSYPSSQANMAMRPRQPPNHARMGQQQSAAHLPSQHDPISSAHAHAHAPMLLGPPSAPAMVGSRSMLLEEFRQRRAAAGPPAPTASAFQQTPASGYAQRYTPNSVFTTSSTDPTANWVLDDIRGHVVEFCMDQHGSRFAQDRLDHASRDQVNWVFEEIRPSARSLMQDVFGNYVVQKMFEYGSTEQRLSLTEEVRTYVVPLSLSTYGCRVIQKALDYLPDSVRLDLAEELKGHVLEMVQDQNANHVVQKLLSVVENPEDVRFISDTFHGRVVSLGAHCYSCRVLQRIFERCGQAQARPLLEELHQSSERLMADQYGNYVIQWILQRGMPQDKMKVIEAVVGKVLALSRHKFASNVVEQVVRAADKSQLRRLASEILEPVGPSPYPYEDESMASANRAANIMMTDQYANYVLQRFIELCEPDQKMKLVSILQPSLIALRRGAGGPGGWTKHLAAVERLVGEAIAGNGGLAGDEGPPGVYRGYYDNGMSGAASPARPYGAGGGGEAGARYGHPVHGNGRDVGVA